MTTTSRFEVKKNYYDIELWRDGKFLQRFQDWEDMLQYCYDLDRYEEEISQQIRLDWT